ncbi:MAG TPA: hypothetical protein VNI83_10585 [Vicinamibacterales bacterium]|nr:hypothetical protein [Vicinamibacterales bacterium]
MRLEEPDTFYVAAPAFLAPGPAGDLLVSDALGGQVLRFDRRGQPLRRYGRRGDGPGEFRSPVAAAAVGDTLLAVADWRLGRVSVFDLRTGAYLRSVRHEGLPFSMQVDGDTVWIGGLNRARGTSFTRWHLAEDTVHYLGPIPAEYRASNLLADAHPYAVVARVARGFLVGFTGHPALFVTDAQGAVRDTIELPAIRRRGVPHDILHRFARPLPDPEIASMVSALSALQPLRSGLLAAVHLDVTVEEGLITADGFVSVLTPDLRQACVDAPFRGSRDGRPVVAFRGDTLLVLEQRVGSAPRATTIVTAYRIDASRCHWIAVRRGGVAAE